MSNIEWDKQEIGQAYCTTAKFKPKIEFLFQTFPSWILLVLLFLFCFSFSSHSFVRSLLLFLHIHFICWEMWLTSGYNIYLFCIPFTVNCHQYGGKKLRTHTHTHTRSLPLPMINYDYSRRYEMNCIHFTANNDTCTRKIVRKRNIQHTTPYAVYSLWLVSTRKPEKR